MQAQAIRDLETALSQVKIGEKYDVLVEVKQWFATDPEGARDVLAQNPLVAQALLRLFVEFKMCATPPDMSLGEDEQSYFPLSTADSWQPPPARSA